jgi:lipid-A-disaccharide synthase
MRYYIIAGEASGDLHGSNLIKSLKKKDPNAEFRVWGGDLMEKEGATLVKHYKDLAFMGFYEVVMNLRAILGNISFCKKDIENYQPDALILIDYPGFNLRISEFAKNLGIPVHFYISPQIWAWKENRIHKIKRTVDKMYVILPFEKDYYKKHDFEVDFVGHPLLDAIDFNSLKNIDQRENQIALLPGSRKQEIQKILPVFVEVAKKHPQYSFVLAAAPSIKDSFLKTIIGDVPIKIKRGKTYEVLKNSKLALITSGTATLEAGLLKTPQIVCYKTSPISYQIGKRLVKIKYICLVNLILDKPAVPELIQGDCSVEEITKQINQLVSGPKRKEMEANYQELFTVLGGGGASDKVAEIITNYQKKKNGNT